MCRIFGNHLSHWLCVPAAVGLSLGYLILFHVILQICVEDKRNVPMYTDGFIIDVAKAFAMVKHANPVSRFLHHVVNAVHVVLGKVGHFVHLKSVDPVCLFQVLQEVGEVDALDRCGPIWLSSNRLVRVHPND